MIILIVLLSLMFCFLVYLFFAPFYLEVDSAKDLYRFRFHRLVSVSLNVRGNFSLLIRVLGLEKEIALKADRQGSPEAETKKKKKRKSRSRPFPFRKAVSVLKSFKVKKCYVRLDTGDMPLNGLLYPLLFWLGWKSGHDIQIDFTGNNVIVLEIKNNLARMSRAWFGSTQ